jgi:hypothetical protein
MRVKYLASNVIKKWDKVTGYITHINSNDTWYELNDQIPRTNKILILYSYKILGNSYTSSSVFMDSETTFISSLNEDGHIFKYDIPAFIKSIQAQPELIVWVNPQNPRQSVLVNVAPQNLVLSLIGLVVIIWALCISILVSDAFKMDITKKIKVLEQKEVVVGE